MTNSIQIFADIGGSLTAELIAQQLASSDRSRPLDVAINSEGGSVADAIAIYNLLRAWPAGVEVSIIGWALSAATIIAMAGRVIRIHEASLMMVHAPMVAASGNARDLRQSASVLEQVAATMRTAYGRTGQKPEAIDSWLSGDDHWFTAQEALAAGLVDEIIAADALAAAPINVFACRHAVPPIIKERIQAMTTATQTPEEIRAAAVRAEGERRTGIRASFAHFMASDGVAELLRVCEDDPSVTVQAAGQRLLAHIARGASPVAGRYVPPMDVLPTGDSRISDFKAAAVDALLIRSGIRIAKPHPQAADLRRMSVVGMAERVLSMHGRSSASMSRDEVIRAALSTSDFPLLLGNLASTALRTGYLQAPATHAGWTGEREVPDFRPRTLAMLSASPSLLKVPEGAEYKYGSFSESAESFKVETFGRLVSFTRQALVNDDLDALTSTPSTLGAAARRLEADMVYAKLVSNPAMSDGKALFHADHGNLASSGAALSVDSLGLARAAMRKQKGLAGEFIDPQPRYLIVPVALETKAEQLLNSTVDPSKSNNTENLEWVRRLVLVADPRLDAASETAWYLAAEPRQVEGIVRAYLEGEARPFLDQQEGWSRDTMEYKGRLDIGVGVVDYRGLYRNPGA
ncbi:ClpP-like prohead protease/major capsid protein fusion protein [Variovorax sp. Sphag1AA]|uniref:ClpP-like prohead protease/major capsid protein fusion protein n=1 Tax=Variovorax sp. Sphag1AA TaxID=2587027 RepID=UPI00161FA403|nr:ClpP-like prohead protease/major capsid protein fusion protein [Variovorax sp. Sphag1AA]MBB3179739.1 ATP-dependent protease ClpP protease subunit [Variovorax sp. Sphag1AA]